MCLWEQQCWASNVIPDNSVVITTYVSACIDCGLCSRNYVR
jgi:hypothetical protein